jgi:tetratricopeptide (TPR) repeat protein
MESVAPPEMSMKFKQGEALEAYAGVADSTLHPTMDWALACDDVGNAYKQRGDLAMADRLFKAGLDVKSNIVVKDHLALASSYDNIGAVSFKRNDTKEAESYLKDSLATTETKLTPDDPQVWARLNSYAKCLIKEKKYAEAEQLYVRAQDFWPADPAYDGARARAALELGCLYSDQHKYGQAAPLLRRALSLATEYYGPLSCNLEPYRERYAHVCYYVGRRPAHRTRHHYVTAHARRRHQQRGQVTARARGRSTPVG